MSNPAAKVRPSKSAEATAVKTPVQDTCNVLIVGVGGQGVIMVSKVLALLAQDPAQALHVLLVELPVSRGGALRVDQALALQKADLRDRDVGKLLPEQREDVPDGEIRAAAHSFPATR